MILENLWRHWSENSHILLSSWVTAPRCMNIKFQVVRRLLSCTKLYYTLSPSILQYLSVGVKASKIWCIESRDEIVLILPISTPHTCDSMEPVSLQFSTCDTLQSVIFLDSCDIARKKWLPQIFTIYLTNGTKARVATLKVPGRCSRYRYRYIIPSLRKFSL